MLVEKLASQEYWALKGLVLRPNCLLILKLLLQEDYLLVGAHLLDFGLAMFLRSLVQQRLELIHHM